MKKFASPMVMTISLFMGSALVGGAVAHAATISTTNTTLGWYNKTAYFSVEATSAGNCIANGSVVINGVVKYHVPGNPVYGTSATTTIGYSTASSPSQYYARGDYYVDSSSTWDVSPTETH